MTQLSVEVRNGRANAIEGVIGPSPTLQIYGGDKPVNTAAPLGDAPVLVSMQLPVDWQPAAVDGAIGGSVTWFANADQAGDAMFYRILDANGKCHVQGTVGQIGVPILVLPDGTEVFGEMEIDAIRIAVGQLVKITSTQLTEPNA